MQEALYRERILSHCRKLAKENKYDEVRCELYTHKLTVCYLPYDTISSTACNSYEGDSYYAMYKKLVKGTVYG